MNTSRLSICGTIARPCPNFSPPGFGTRRDASSEFDDIIVTECLVLIYMQIWLAEVIKELGLGIADEAISQIKNHVVVQDDEFLVIAEEERRRRHDVMVHTWAPLHVLSPTMPISCFCMAVIFSKIEIRY